MKVIKVMTRIFLEPELLRDTISFYENLFGEKCDVRFSYDEYNLELAEIGSVLLISGPDEILEKFKNTSLTILVDSLNEFRDHLTAEGAEVIDEIKSVPTGFNMRIRHPDGTVVEYVEFKT
jgi:predicted enzyme related to lactoylglutathione lyase